MYRHRVSALFVVAASVLLSACDEADVLRPHVPSSAEAALRQGGEGPVDEGQRPFVALQLNASGGQSDQSIRIEASGTLLIAGAVSLSISAPEVVSARRTGWGEDFALILDETLAPIAESQVVGGRGYRGTMTASLQVRTPGWYRLVLSARLLEARESVQPDFFHEFQSQEVWLHVTPNRVRVVDRFQPPPNETGFVPVPGPFRHSARSISGNQSRGEGAGYDVARDGGQDVIKVRYYHPRLGSYEPVPNKEVAVTYYVYDYGGWEPVGGQGFTTDANGNVYWNCPEPGYGESFVISTEVRSPEIQIQPNTTVEDGYTSCTYADIVTLLLPGVGAHVWKNTRITASNAVQEMGYSRGPIVIRIHEAVTRYVLNDDAIEFEDDDVWAPRGPWSIAHEYGHAYHKHALGGYVSCGKQHYITDAINYECAWTEGFADYFASEIGPLVWYDFETEDFTAYGCVDRDYNTSICYSWSSTPNGPLVESAVAAVLTDLTDGAADSGDILNAPHSYIADLAATCSTNGGEITGIDIFLVCAENSLSAYEDGYFLNRPRPTSFSENAAEPSGWSQSAVRMNWLHNLYDNEIPLDVRISGPGTLMAGEWGQWSASVDNASGTITYSWYRRNVGTSTYEPVGTGVSVSLEASYSDFNLRVVAAVGGDDGSDQHEVAISTTSPPGGGDRCPPMCVEAPKADSTGIQ